VSELSLASYSYLCGACFEASPRFILLRLQVKGKKHPTEVFQIGNNYISVPKDTVGTPDANRIASQASDLPLHHAPSWETQVIESHKAWMSTANVMQEDKAFSGENPVETVMQPGLSPKTMCCKCWFSVSNGNGLIQAEIIAPWHSINYPT
jgi:hypothetical protein